MPTISHMPGTTNGFFTQSAGNIFSIYGRFLSRYFTGTSYEPMTYLLLWKPRLLLFDRLGGEF
jgi:hypothetical protein